MGMIEYALALVGLLTTFYFVGFGGYKLFTYIRGKKNPVKEYIRREVMEYLKELQND